MFPSLVPHPLISHAPGPRNSTWKCEICVAGARRPEQKEKNPRICCWGFEH